MKKVCKMAALSLSMLFIFCSCSSDAAKVACVFGKAQVPADVYTYYIDYVISNSDDKNQSRGKVLEKASALCEEYVKVNTKFHDLKLTLTQSEKATIANDVNDYWGMFGDYYSEADVSKSTFTKIYESNAYKEKLLYKYYDTNGIDPVSEDSIKSYFTEHYILFKAITGYINSENKDSLTEKFNTMAQSITASNTIDAVNKAYQIELGETAADALDVSILDKSSDSYPNGFFDQVSKMEYGKPQVLIFEDYIFIVQRIDGFADSTNYYSDYRSDCLKAVSSDKFAKLLGSWYKDLNLKNKTGEQKRCYNEIMSARED